MPVPSMQLLAAKAPAASGSFLPSDLADLSGWWDASSSANFTFSSGSNIATWLDSSGNSKTLINAGTPTLTRTIGGVSAVDFNGSSSLYRNSCPINNVTTGAWTIFAVVEFDGVSGIQNVVDGDVVGGTRVGQYLRANGAGAESIGFVSAVAKTDTYVTSLAAATPVIMRSLNGGTTTIEVFVAGVGNGSTSLGGTQNYNSAKPFYIGQFAGSGSYLNGAMGEVITYSVALGASDIASVESYLTTKWGL